MTTHSSQLSLADVFTIFIPIFSFLIAYSVTMTKKYLYISICISIM